MVKKVFIGLIAMVIFVVIAVAVYTFPRIHERPQDDIEPRSTVYQKAFRSASQEADAWLERLYRDHHVPSISAAVGVGGQLVWSGTIGYANVKEKILADHDSQYRIGSISKSMTATAVMKLAEKNLIGIDLPFHHFARSFAGGHENYTIRQLLSHQAGIRHYSSGLDGVLENFRNTQYNSRREAASIIENDRRLFSPGTGFHYSTYGYTLVSLAMESVDSMTFQDLMHREVFSPLALSSTEFDSANNQNKALPYLLIENTLLEAPDVNLSYKYAGGGVISTPSDVVKFGLALLGNEFLSDKAKAELLTPMPLKNGEMNPQNYALGFRVDPMGNGVYVHHGGMSVGGFSFFAIYPGKDVVIVFSLNVTPSAPIFDRHVEAKKLANIFSEK